MTTQTKRAPRPGRPEKKHNARPERKRSDGFCQARKRALRDDLVLPYYRERAVQQVDILNRELFVREYLKAKRVIRFTHAKKLPRYAVVFEGPELVMLGEPAKVLSQAHVRRVMLEALGYLTPRMNAREWHRTLRILFSVVIDVPEDAS